MSRFRDLKGALGSRDEKLQESGLLARGDVLICRRTAMSVGNQVPSVVCELTLRVHLPGYEPFEASCHHPIEMPYLPQLEQGGASVAVRVDPDDHSHITLDLATEPPPAGPVGDAGAAEDMGSALGGIPLDGSEPIPTHRADPALGGEAGILANGIDCRAVLLAAVDLHTTTSAGKPATGLVLSVTVPGNPSYQAQVGVYVPPEATPLLAIGIDLPGRVRPESPNDVVIDWTRALAEHHGTGTAAAAEPPATLQVPAPATPSPWSPPSDAVPLDDTPAAVLPGPGAPGLADQLAQLHAAGALSDDEFAAAKARLLGT